MFSKGIVSKKLVVKLNSDFYLDKNILLGFLSVEDTFQKLSNFTCLNFKIFFSLLFQGLKSTILELNNYKCTITGVYYPLSKNA